MLSNSLRFRFFHINNAALELHFICFNYCDIRLIIVWHLNKTIAFGAFCYVVPDDFARRNGAETFK